MSRSSYRPPGSLGGLRSWLLSAALAVAGGCEDSVDDRALDSGAAPDAALSEDSSAAPLDAALADAGDPGTPDEDSGEAGVDAGDAAAGDGDSGVRADADAAEPDPFDAPATCTSMDMRAFTQVGSQDMNPGHPCISCHLEANAQGTAESPIFAAAGTVYPTAHEPDGCVPRGVYGAEVEITDATGTVYTAPVTGGGNFMLSDPNGDFTPPYQARVLFQGRVRAMAAEQTDGDCNGCHTQDGANEAPGRILLP